MKKTVFDLWEKTPGMCQEIPRITAYEPDEKRCDGAVVIYPGGGYNMRAAHEGEGYALFFAAHGITSFVCDYRVNPHTYPLPMLDARRAVRFVRYHAAEYGIRKDRIMVMGSSAGGHLAAVTSTHMVPLEGEGVDDIDREEFRPNGQILCYAATQITRMYNAYELSPDKNVLMSLCADLVADEHTPPAFIWHTFDDPVVDVTQVLEYAKRLKLYGVETEMHIYPHGRHGLGLSQDEPYVADWSRELLRWLGRSWNAAL